MPDVKRRTCSHGHHELPISGVCPVCWRIYREEPYPKDVTPTVIEPTIDDHGATIHPGGEVD